jgi:hypothetical protein
LNPKPAFAFTSAANSELLPQPKPRAMREHFVVPSIGSRDVACAEWSDIRRFEHFPQLLNLVNDAFNVHSLSISDMGVAFVKRGGICMSCVAAELMTNVTCLRIAADERLAADGGEKTLR